LFFNLILSEDFRKLASFCGEDSKEFSKKANAKNFQRKQTQRIFKENTNTAKRKSFQKKTKPNKERC